MENVESVETVYCIFNSKTQKFYRSVGFGNGHYQQELKTWKTLAGATKALSKVKNKQDLSVKLLTVKDINE